MYDCVLCLQRKHAIRVGDNEHGQVSRLLLGNFFFFFFFWVKQGQGHNTQEISHKGLVLNINRQRGRVM